ncbi:MAG: hypothetical protein GY861_02565 [bacterium]|nr:hypothetical protein [bacterium]
MFGKIKVRVVEVEAIVGKFQISKKGTLEQRNKRLYLNYLKPIQSETSSPHESFVFEFRTVAFRTVLMVSKHYEYEKESVVLISLPEVEKIISAYLVENGIEDAYLSQCGNGEGGQFELEFQFMI